MEEKQVLALGFFDGVHAGHGALLRECRSIADRLSCRAAALTFASHPDALVFGAAPALINTPEDRELLLRRLYGMDSVLTLPFDRAMMTMAWQDFFALLLHKYHAAGLICGHDFRFGDRGAGTAALLKEAAEKAGIPCTVIPEQKIRGITVSSTYIRTLLEAGNVEEAARFLGHPHIFSGTVVHGRQLGRTIGIPTANLTLPPELLRMRMGVYACLAHVNGTTVPAVTNIGTRPTVDGSHLTVEPWLLGLEEDLYGKSLTLEFHRFLRPEKKFDSLEDLRREIQKNAEETLKFFGKC